MNTLILLGVIFVAIFVVNEITRNKKQRRVHVIGQELATADKKEKERLNRDDIGESPLKGMKYSLLGAGSSLVNPQESLLDEVIIEVVENYRKAPESKREEIRLSLSQDDLYEIFEFCKRGAVFGLRNKNNYLLHCLAALSMVDINRVDYRDAIVALNFVDYVIKKLDIDSAKLYAEAAELADGKMRKYLNSIQSRVVTNGSLEKMVGYTEYHFPQGVGFVMHLGKPYSPKNDLVGIAFRINEEFIKDVYKEKEGAIQVATEVPKVWLRGGDGDEMDKLLEDTSGVVTLSLDLKEEGEENRKYQMLLFILVEFKNSDSAKELLRAVGNEEHPDFARILGHGGDMFYLLIARSYVQGLEDYESSKTLERFRDVIEEMIEK